MRFRTTTFKQFSQVFNTETEEEAEEKERRERQTGTLKDKWGWYQTIYLLANENLLNFDEVVKKPVYECLTFLSYQQDLNKKRQDEYRQHKI